MSRRNGVKWHFGDPNTAAPFNETMKTTTYGRHAHSGIQVKIQRQCRKGAPVSVADVRNAAVGTVGKRYHTVTYEERTNINARRRFKEIRLKFIVWSTCPKRQPNRSFTVRPQI